MKVYFHGNCQAGALARMIKEAIPELEVTCREIHHNHHFEDRAAYLEDLKTADAIVTQPIGPTYHLGADRSTEFVRREARTGSPVIVMPAMHFDGQFPEWSYLRHRGIILPIYKMEYHNLFAFQAALLRENVDSFIERILSPTFYSRKFIELTSEWGVGELEKRERNLHLDVTVSDLIRERCRTHHVMFTINHPRRPILVGIANRVLRCLKIDGEVPEEGVNEVAFPDIPLLPSVARQLSGETETLGKFHVHPDTEEDQESFYRGAHAHYRALPWGLLYKTYRMNRPARDILAFISSQNQPRWLRRSKRLMAYANIPIWP